MTLSSPLLEIADLHVKYGTLEAIHGVTLNVNDGEAVVLLGPNGAGKSTLLKAISGIATISSGQITFGGMDIRRSSPRDIVKRGIIHIPEGRRLFTTLSVLENLEVGAYLRRDGQQIRRDIDSILAYLPALTPKLRERASLLSGGEQQMLAIARGLVARPVLLLVDEPSLGLSPLLVEQLTTLLADIKKQFNTALLLVEQNTSLGLGVASRAYVMHAGKVVISARTDELRRADLSKSYLGLNEVSGSPAQSGQ